MSENLTSVNEVGARECRTCLTKLKCTDTIYDLFYCWKSLWDGTKATLADDLAKLANIKILKEDEHTNFICKQCHSNLISACQFVSCTQNSDRTLKQRLQPWPEPIRLDVIRQVQPGNEVEIKQELMSDEECEVGNEEFSGVTEIKIEPEEFMQPSASSDNGIMPVDCNIIDLPNGTAESNNDKLLVETIKEEPCSEEAGVDLPLDCILCSKTFNSVRGLRAHVIAQHSYKTVKRKTGSSPQKKKSEKYMCQTCRRVFQTQTDLMVHETCHDKHTCFACTQKFDTFALLTKHRKRCKAVSSKQKHKTLEDVIRPVSNKNKQKVAGKASKSNNFTNGKPSLVSSTKANQVVSKYFVKNLKTLNEKESTIALSKVNQTNAQNDDQTESQDNEAEMNGNDHQIGNYDDLVEMRCQDDENSQHSTSNDAENPELFNYGALEPNTNDPPDLEATGNENRNSNDHNSGILNYGALIPNTHQPLEEANLYILGDTEIRYPNNDTRTVTNSLQPDDTTENDDIEMTILNSEVSEGTIIDANEYSSDSCLSIKITKIVSEATDSNLQVSADNVELNDFSIEDENVDNIPLKSLTNNDLPVVDTVTSDDTEL